MYYSRSLFEVVLILVIVGFVFAIMALRRVRKLRKDFDDLRNQVRFLQEDWKKHEHPIPPVEMARPIEAEPAPMEALEPSGMPPEEAVPAPPREKILPLPSPAPSLSLEMKLGTKWLNWVGIVMLLAGIGFFLKYAYDNAWIGPKGRLAIGVFLGIAALGLGERFRRRDWSVLFQVFTGGALAAFYLCVYFSFQVYHLAGQTVAMILAVLVTALAVALAVAHNAVSVAILALIGGFLSPILVSTGVNRPYAFFTYIAILDMVAMGAAYFRRWRALDLLCLIGTTMMYLAWHERFYGPDQMVPALIYTSLFYLMFLLIPTLHSLVRRLRETPEGLIMVILSALLSLLSYYHILYSQHRAAMGFVVIGQALLVFLLFQVWMRRVGMESNISAGLLTITLGLVTIAIPIQLELYGIPIAWGMEGAVLVFLGIRFGQTISKMAGIAALVLATIGLLHRLPLHNLGFIPVFNIPFGSWSLVIAMSALSAYLLYKQGESGERWGNILAPTSLLLTVSLACLLISMEVSQFWTINSREILFQTYEASSLIFLWSLIPGAITFIIWRKKAKEWIPLAWACFGIGALVLFVGLEHYTDRSRWLFMNTVFTPRLIFALSLLWGANLYRQLVVRRAPEVQTLAAHALLALLLALEFNRWGRYSDLITPKMGVSLISAAWGVQAFIVIWVGLAKRNPLLRYLGFVLFLVTVGKTLIIDMSQVEKVYRIISFAASGVLLVAAGYFYQRYSSKILEKDK